MLSKAIRFTFLFLTILHSVLGCPDDYWQPIRKGLVCYQGFFCQDEEASTPNDASWTDELRPFFCRIWEKEEQHKDAYHSFVTGQNSTFYCVQVVLKALYGETAEPYEYLRLRHQLKIESIDQFFESYPSLAALPEIPQEIEDRIDSLEEEDLNDEDLKQLGLWGSSGDKPVCDVSPEISKELIAASLHPQCAKAMDSVLHVFAEGRGVAQSGDKLAESILVDAFLHHGLSKELAENTAKECLAEAPRSERGMIMQIFVPKKEAQDFFYVSLAGGALHKRADKDYAEYRKLMRERTTRADFNPLEHGPQVRLLASKLTPDKVLIYRHTMIPEEQQAAFEVRVQEIVDRALTST